MKLRYCGLKNQILSDIFKVVIFINLDINYNILLIKLIYDIWENHLKYVFLSYKNNLNINYNCNFPQK